MNNYTLTGINIPPEEFLRPFFGLDERVFRLPGFYHCKEEPIMVECIKFNPELRYTQEQLETVLPDIPDEPAPVISSNCCDP
jgi:hypothetical protein